MFFKEQPETSKSFPFGFRCERFDTTMLQEIIESGSRSFLKTFVDLYPRCARQPGINIKRIKHNAQPFPWWWQKTSKLMAENLHDDDRNIHDYDRKPPRWWQKTSMIRQKTSMMMTENIHDYDWKPPWWWQKTSMMMTENLHDGKCKNKFKMTEE